jgi:hypothetical protein
MLNNLEQAALRAFRAGDSSMTSAAPLSGREDWLRFGIGCLLEIGARVRSMHFTPLAGAVVFKGDGSPSVPEEYAIEQYLRDRLQPIAPTASVMGEESGGALSEGGISVAIDPVDGHLGAGQSQLHSRRQLSHSDSTIRVVRHPGGA